MALRFWRSKNAGFRHAVLIYRTMSWSTTPVITVSANINNFHKAITIVWHYRISKLDMISISSHLLVPESIIIKPVICTSAR